MTNEQTELLELSDDFTALEKEVLRLFVARSDDIAERLREQLRCVSVSKREHTGVGFFTHMQISEEVFVVRDLYSSPLDGVFAQHLHCPAGAGFLLFFRDGVVDCLEGYTFDGPWPADESHFKFRIEPTNVQQAPVVFRRYPAVQLSDIIYGNQPMPTELAEAIRTLRRDHGVSYPELGFYLCESDPADGQSFGIGRALVELACLTLNDGDPAWK